MFVYDTKVDTYGCLQSSWGCQESPPWAWSLWIHPSYSGKITEVESKKSKC